MAISVFLKAFARRAQLPSSLSSYESVLRNVNSPRTSPLLGKQFTSLGSRAYCSKADQSDPSAQNQTKKLPDSNLTKVVFKYVCANDESQNDNRPSNPPNKKGDDLRYYNLSDFCYSYLVQLKETAESTYGVRAAGICFVEASLFKEHIRSLMDSAADALNIEDLKIYHIAKIEDFSPNDNNLGTGCGLRVVLDDIFQIRTWETMTIDDDKHLLVVILSELKRNGFDFTNDSMTLQNIAEAVERAKTRKINTIKLNLPVPAGEPDMSTTIS
ncbi:hypothetical protein MKW98_024250 [Papaver atlanticum]|uniref:Uncharacterized protein n=1 Tax=Papaver atlanticum TaxID=357466 RepID=A0AAD4T0A7_9MAGN|nr:hypothetical protein MKW98_024250 [Papaver atlanticum]